MEKRNVKSPPAGAKGTVSRAVVKKAVRAVRAAKYKQRQDGEGFSVPSGEVHRISCCDCGLVHDFVFISNDGLPIGIAARRNYRAMAQKRRNMTKPDVLQPSQSTEKQNEQ